jgi:molybdopterin molybdotransferase
VKIFVSERPGANGRPAGCNVVAGDLVLPRGTAIGPAQVSSLAAIGRTSVRVFRRPVFAIIATGDELVAPGRPIAPGKAYNCNAAAMAAMVSHYGGVPRVLGIARDNEASLLAKIRAGLAADAIITTGGVSRGDYDLVRLVIGQLGRVVFSRIRMGPGRAFAFGTLDREDGRSSNPVFALTGPPNGCLNNFELLVRPALLKMLGFTRLEHPAVVAVAEDAVASKKPVAFIKWTNLYKDGDEYRVILNCPEGTGPLEEVATANSLTVIPEGVEVKKGDRIKVLPLDWCWS